VDKNERMTLKIGILAGAMTCESLVSRARLAKLPVEAAHYVTAAAFVFGGLVKDARVLREADSVNLVVSVSKMIKAADALVGDYPVDGAVVRKIVIDVSRECVEEAKRQLVAGLGVN
jgi:hypothetical protein